MSARPLNFESQIHEIFGHDLVKDYRQDADKQCLSFNVESAYGERTFEQLEKLSKLLGTRYINLNEAFVADRGCESCGHGYSIVIPISCSGIIFYPCRYRDLKVSCN